LWIVAPHETILCFGGGIGTWPMSKPSFGSLDSLIKHGIGQLVEILGLHGRDVGGKVPQRPRCCTPY
jgi:hypothetical protein